MVHKLSQGLLICPAHPSPMLTWLGSSIFSVCREQTKTDFLPTNKKLRALQRQQRSENTHTSSKHRKDMSYRKLGFHPPFG